MSFQLTEQAAQAIIKCDLTAEAVGLPHYSELIGAAANVLCDARNNGGVRLESLQALAQLVNMMHPHRVK